ncbi:unnamed protein product [Eretmochelys imbricata]
MAALRLKITLSFLCQLVVAGSTLEIGSYDIERGVRPDASPSRSHVPGHRLQHDPHAQLRGHENQQEAAIKLHEFAPLVEYGCHGHLRFFLCSLYAPMCTDQVSTSIPACKPMCEQARHKCAPIMEQFNLAGRSPWTAASCPPRTTPMPCAWRRRERHPRGRSEGTGHAPSGTAPQALRDRRGQGAKQLGVL